MFVDILTIYCCFLLNDKSYRTDIWLHTCRVGGSMLSSHAWRSRWNQKLVPSFAIWPGNVQRFVLLWYLTLTLQTTLTCILQAMFHYYQEDVSRGVVCPTHYCRLIWVAVESMEEGQWDFEKTSIDLTRLCIVTKFGMLVDHSRLQLGLQIFL